MDNVEDTALPHTARSLCKKAMEVGNSLKAEVSKEELNAAIEEYTRHAIILANSLPHCKLSIDATDVNEVFDTLNNEQSANKLFEELGTNDNPALATSLAKPTDPKLGSALIGWALVRTVKELKTKENTLLNNNTLGYAEIACQLDADVKQISSLLSGAKSFKPGIEHITNKITRAKGAQKGGQVRKEKFRELRLMVIEEARAFYSDKKGAKAARAIHEKFSKKGNLLNDEKGKALSIDPVPLFTKWVNEDRKEAKSSA